MNAKSEKGEDKIGNKTFPPAFHPTKRIFFLCFSGACRKQQLTAAVVFSFSKKNKVFLILSFRSFIIIVYLN